MELRCPIFRENTVASKQYAGITSDSVPSDMVAQRGFRSAAHSHTDQNLHWVFFGQPIVQGFVMRTTKTDQTVQICSLI